MSLYTTISEKNRERYGTEFEKVLRIIINQYSDRTHFIYEILQNSEDAGATYIKFKLKNDQLEIYHNGRPFNERDIEGVCGIANGTKEDGTRIGHFGIGFKSVYCYTETPFIYSGAYHFQIVNQLFPKEVSSKTEIDFEETCMILPFNKEGVAAEIAYQEIKDALIRKITAESILMLNNIADVVIDIDGHGEIIEINKAKYPIDNTNPDNVFGLSLRTTIKGRKTDKERTNDADYLFFTDAEKEATAIVFKVDEKELKAVKNSKIYAFFPTAKEAHQNFYIHAPFDTTPARDNFKEGAEYGKHNLKLVKSLGELIWFAFTWMRDHKYLSVSGFNTVFPIYEYEEDDILYGLYKNSIDIIREEIILPTNTPYEFKRINEVYMPMAGVVAEVFSDEDLRSLMNKRNVSWLAKEFATDAFADLRKYLNNNFNIQSLEWKDLVSRLDASFLKAKPLSWIERLMSRIEGYCIKRMSSDGHYINTADIPFVRTAGGDQICARDKNGHLQVYLNNPDIAKYRIDYQFVSSEIVRSFYQRVLLIPEYNIEQEAIERVLPKYETRNVKFKTTDPIQENIKDLKIIKDAIYTNPSILDKLQDKYIVTDGNNWYCPSEMYIKSGDVRSGYSLVRGLISFRFLTERYFDDTVLSIKLDEDFFKKIGCSSGLRVIQTPREEYLKAVRKYQGYETEKTLRHSIFIKNYVSRKLNWAFCYEGFPEVFHNMTIERSIAIARFLNPNAMNFDILGELVGADDQHFSGKNVDSATAYSMLGLMLCFEKWIYIKGDDTPYSPLEVDKDDILDEYRAAKRLIDILPFKEVNDAYVAWLEAGVGNKADVELIKRFLPKPEDLVQVAKARAKKEAADATKKRKGIKDLIEQGDKNQQEGHSHNTEIEISPMSEKGKKRREENLDKELAATLDNYVRVAKGLQFASRTSNKDERAFLEQEYDGVCQICGEQILKHNGDVYFEAINVIKYNELPEELNNSSKFGWNSLCLCPNCAAKYNYSSKKISDLYEQVMKLEVIPGSEETIDICIELPKGRKKYIHYTPRHFMALKEALKIFAEVQ